MASINYRNIYYMLIYGESYLDLFQDGDTGIESCNSSLDILAYLLIKAYKDLATHQIYKEYITIENRGNRPRGKIDIIKSVRNSDGGNKTLNFSYHKLTLDNNTNRLLKMALNYLIIADNTHRNLNKEYRNGLEVILAQFSAVSNVKYSLDEIKKFNRENKNVRYKTVIACSIIVLLHLLPVDGQSGKRVFELSDDSKLKYIFETFVCKLLQKELSNITVIRKKTLLNPDGIRRQPDVILEYTNKIVILDTKWYESTPTASNQNQMLSYIIFAKNSSEYEDKHIEGIILYAKSEKTEGLKNNIDFWGNVLHEHEIDMSTEFEVIKNRLINLGRLYFNKEE